MNTKIKEPALCIKEESISLSDNTDKTDCLMCPVTTVDTINRQSLLLSKAFTPQALFTAFHDLKKSIRFKETVQKVIKTREWTKAQLAELGFTFPDSKTNFIFATHKEVPAKEIFEMLKKEKIYVRYFNKPRIDNYLRISIGTDEEMQKLVECFKKRIGA